MTRVLVPLVAVVAAGGALLVPSADAKFQLSLATDPARPTARNAARVIVRTDADLPKAHGIRLTAVGPWRDKLGQGIFEIRLAWRTPRMLTGRIRFPYPGRWELHVPVSAASGAGAVRIVRVRPAR